MANPESRGLPVTRLSLLTHLSEVGTVATQVRMRGMKLSELSPSHLQKIQAESQHAPSVWSPVWGLQTLTSFLSSLPPSLPLSLLPFPQFCYGLKLDLPTSAFQVCRLQGCASVHGFRSLLLISAY